jgi:hypothetical protein
MRALSEPGGSAGLVRRREGDGARAELLEISRLLPADSPRSRGTDPEHVKRLAQIETPLPPILVYKPTLQVIDGMHRLQAAKLRKRTHIEVIFFDGSETDAVILAITENVSHGLPLSLADRRKAASRILSVRPELSDRAVGEKAGLAAATVRSIRQRSTAQNEQSATRIGKDGRTRPVNPAAAREQVRKLLEGSPQSSLAEIAEAAGVSVKLARAVRDSMHADSMPSARRAPVAGKDAEQNTGQQESQVGNHVAANSGQVTPPPPALDCLMRKLQSDISARSADARRETIRWLHRHALGVREDLPDLGWIPPDCISDVVSIARESAAVWERLADSLPKESSANG